MDQTGPGAMNAAAGPKIIAGAHGSIASQTVAADTSRNSQIDLVREMASAGATSSRQRPRIPGVRQLHARSRPVQRRKAERRPGKDHERPARIREKRVQQVPAGVALHHRPDRQEDDGHEQRDAEARFEREDVDREERRPDQLLIRPVASRDHHWMAMRVEECGQLVLGERTAEVGFAILDGRVKVLGQLANDVVLLRPRQEEPNGLQVSVQ